MTIFGQKVYGDSTDIAGRSSANLTDKSAVALKYFMGQGFSQAQASGIVGNLLWESGLNEGKQEVGGKGFGLAQWDTTRQKEFAKVNRYQFEHASILVFFLFYIRMNLPFPLFPLLEKVEQKISINFALHLYGNNFLCVIYKNNG